jgi:peptidoglycan L-alanyl-D-glutamate endopeptidase CwlK
MVDTKDMRPLAVRKMNEHIVACAKEHIFIKTTCGFRTGAQQAYDYAQGRTRLGPIITNAPQGTSMHEYGIAWDICFDKTMHPYIGDWARVAAIATSLGIENGDSGYTDTPHHQLRCGYTDQQIIHGQVDLKKWL